MRLAACISPFDIYLYAFHYRCANMYVFSSAQKLNAFIEERLREIRGSRSPLNYDRRVCSRAERKKISDTALSFCRAKRISFLSPYINITIRTPCVFRQDWQPEKFIRRSLVQLLRLFYIVTENFSKSYKNVVIFFFADHHSFYL